MNCKKIPYFVSWSGGKDSCLALSCAVEKFGKPSFLLNMLTEDGERSRSHGLAKNVLQAQADALEIPILFYKTSWNEYEKNFLSALNDLSNKGIKMGVFGDMQLKNQNSQSNNRQWADRVCQTAGLMAFEPLWEYSEEDLLHHFFLSGIKAQIIAIKDSCLEAKYLGQFLTRRLIEELQQKKIHPLGEYGEYHTVVIDSPLFSKSLDVMPGDSVFRSGYWFLDMACF